MFQWHGGEAERQVPSPRLLHLHGLQHQPKAKGTFLCGGQDLLWEARTRASDPARGLRRGHRLPQVEHALCSASDCTPTTGRIDIIKDAHKRLAYTTPASIQSSLASCFSYDCVMNHILNVCTLTSKGKSVITTWWWHFFIFSFYLTTTVFMYPFVFVHHGLLNDWYMESPNHHANRHVFYGFIK